MDDFFGLEDILDSIDEDSEIEKSDESSKRNESRTRTMISILESYQKTDKKLLDTLNDTVDLLKDREKEKVKLKKYFFNIIMFVFFLLCVSPVAMLYFFRNIITNQSFIVTILGTFVELITAIIILPKIIANYLFNLDEDKAYFQLISELKIYHENKSKYIDDIEK